MGKLKRRATVKIQARKVLATLPEDRTDADISSVIALTNRSSFFWGMDKELQKNIARALRLETHQPHDIVLKEGDIPSANARFYIVLTGQVAVYQHTEETRAVLLEQENRSRPSTSNSHHRPHADRHGDLLITLGAGSHFGERALLSSEPRSATVTAFKSTVELLYLSRQDYERLLASADRKALNEIKDALAACLGAAAINELGDAIDEKEITKLSYYVEWQQVGEGTAICVEGNQADRLIFLVEGEALVTRIVREPPVGKLEVANISSMGPYSTYGASEFVRSTKLGGNVPKYTMSLRAKTQCRFLYLSRLHLQRIQKLVAKLLIKCATVAAMKQLFWFNRLSQYKSLPGHLESFTPAEDLPETSQELYDVVKQAMDAAHTKRIFPNLSRPHAHKVSNMAHHAWPFGSVADAAPKRRPKKSLSLQESLQGMYKEGVDMTWHQAKNKHERKEQFSTAKTSAGSTEDVPSLQSLKMSKLIKDACKVGSFELLIKARDDAEAKARMHIEGGVTATALYGTNELQCCSPVKSQRTILQRMSDRESVLEAEILGLDQQLENIRGSSSIVKQDVQQQEELMDDADDLAVKITTLSPHKHVSLQPHIPHVLHDLPMLFPRRGTRPQPKLLPMGSRQTKLHHVPEAFKVLWKKPSVIVPHYSSASPELLAAFINGLSQSL